MFPMNLWEMAIYRTFGICLVIFLVTVLYGQAQERIDPCYPPSPCLPGTKMRNLADCFSYYECIIPTDLSDVEPRWTLKECGSQTQYDETRSQCREFYQCMQPVEQPMCGNTVIRHPRFGLELLTSKQLKEGEQLRLTSILSRISEHTPVKFSWLSDKQTISETGNRSRTIIKLFAKGHPGTFSIGSTLTTDPVSVSDSGDIQCIVNYEVLYFNNQRNIYERNDNDNRRYVKYVLFSDVWTLKVRRRPFLSLSAKTLTVYPDERIVLTCVRHVEDAADLGGGYFDWRFNGEKYTNPDDIVNYRNQSIFHFNITARRYNRSSIQIECAYIVYNLNDEPLEPQDPQETTPRDINETQLCNVHILQRNDPVCPNSFDQDLKVRWSRTVPGRPSIQKCPREQEGVCTRSCFLQSDGLASWAAPDCSSCVGRPLLDILRKIDRVEQGVGLSNSSFVASIANSLANRTNTTTSLNPASIYLAVDALTRLSALRRDYENYSANHEEINSIVNSISNLLEPHNNESWDMVQKKNSTLSAMLLSSADVYGDSLSRLLNQSIDCPVISITSENMILEASCAVTMRETVISFPNGTENEDWSSSSNDQISISIGESGNHLPLRLSSSYYRNIENYLLGKSDTAYINSRILSLSINGTQTGVTKLRQPIKLSLQHSNEKEGNWTAKCVFWDFSIGNWSDSGCSLISTNATRTVCQCDHLTNFAILMSLSPSDDAILSIISTVGCCLTVIALCLTVIAYVIIWKIVKSDQAVVLMNLCAALIVANVIFLAGAEKTDPRVGCVTVAVLLHYFFLAAFFMMLSEGVGLIFDIIFVFHVRRTRETVMIILSAWILPLIIVAVSLGITQTDGYGHNKACWLSVENGLIWAFVGPVLCIMLTNFIILVVILRKIAVGRFPANKNVAKSKIRATIWNIAVVSPILGIAWVFGVLSVSFNLVVFQYLFAIANSLQGLLIFTFHVFFNKKLTDNIKKTSGYGLLFSRFSTSSMETSRNTDSDNVNKKAKGCDVVKGEEANVPKLVKHYEGLSDQEAAAAAAAADDRRPKKKKDEIWMHSLETTSSEIDQS